MLSTIQDAFRRRFDDGVNDHGPDVDRSDLTFEFDHSNRTRVTFDGRRYDCSWSASPDGQWRVAFGPDTQGQGCRVFGIRDGAIRYSVRIERPTGCWIANDGTAIVVDGGRIGDTNSTAAFLTPDSGATSESTVSLSTNIGSAAISPDGRFGAFTSIGVRNVLHLYDLEADDERAQHVLEDGTGHFVSFDESGGDCYLYDSRQDVLVYAVDVDGNRTWRHPQFTERVPAFTRTVNHIRTRIGF